MIAPVEAPFLWTTTILGVGLLISTLEHLWNHRYYRSEGMFSWEVVQLSPVFLRYPQLTQLFAPVFATPGILVVFMLRLLAVVGLLLGVFLSGSLWAVCMIPLLLSTLVLNMRSMFQSDGSDHMTTSITVCIVLYSWFPHHPWIPQVLLWFMTAQACLAYVTSGVAKVVSPAWRSGEALWKVLNTESYGHRGLAKFLMNKPKLVWLLAWGVMGLEVAFPLAVLLGEPVLYFVFLAAAVMHLSIAVFMRINSFFWAFLATYPAVWACSAGLWG